jgi:rifampicin phosphotransferase
LSTPYLLPLDSPDATLANAGGKGANLAWLIRAGLPVPGGFIVTTAAYDAFVAANNLGLLCTRAVTAIDTDNPASLEAVSAAIRARFGAGRLPDDLAAALRDAYLSQEISCMAVAVRSSATAEDLPELSFAGQQDTFLNVVGEEALLRAVVDCWSSLWTGRAIGYRARNGIPQDSLSLAVVVQTMVEAEAAGVLFTANPLTGNRTESVINATLGLGEALVSGRVEPDQYVVANRSGGIVSKQLGSKLVAIRGISGGGTALETEAAGATQALPDASIVELAALGERVAALLGAPQDIEWALDVAGKLWLLQARPITSLYPLPAGLDPYGNFMLLASFGAVQGVLDPLTPLGRDVWRATIAAATRMLGYDYTYDNQQVLFVAGERLFINGTGGLRNGFGRRLLRGILGQVEPGVGAIVRPLLDDPRLSVTSERLSLGAIRRMAPIILPLARRFLVTWLRPDAARKAAEADLEQAVAYFAGRAAAAHTLEERLTLFDEVAVVLRRFLLPRLLPRFAVGMAALNRLYRLAAPLPGGHELALQITRGLPHNVTTEMDLALWETTRRIQADPLSTAMFREQDSATLARTFQAGQLPRAGQEAIAAFLGRYGMRGLAEIDLGRPRWREDPTPVMAALRSYVQIQDRASAPDAVFAWGARTAESATGTLATRLAGQPGGRRKAGLARWYTRRVRALAGLRESPKFTLIRLLDMARAALLDSGRELTAAGMLDRPDDIFFLGLADLHQLAGKTPTASPRETVARHKAAYEREQRRKLVPRVLLSDGQAFYEGVPAGGTAGEKTLTGSPVSPGTVEGAVRVVLDPRGAHLQPGEILVCPGTDPSWTPLFLAAGGLVMEVGGLMTHGSVVAREYGIPAVVGVAHATTRLRTGQRIRVDGSSGLVAILNETADPGKQ